MANCMTLVRMVIAPTATSPPYFNRDELKQTEMMLSLACMTNVAVPRATQGRMTDFFSFILDTFNRSWVFFPQRKEMTQTQEIAWEITVASAPPFTPMPIAKIKIGSRMILITAPISTESIPVFAYPCVVMNIFIPSVIWTKMVPMA